MGVTAVLTTLGPSCTLLLRLNETDKHLKVIKVAGVDLICIIGALLAS